MILIKEKVHPYDRDIPTNNTIKIILTSTIRDNILTNTSFSFCLSYIHYIPPILVVMLIANRVILSPNEATAPIKVKVLKVIG